MIYTILIKDNSGVISDVVSFSSVTSFNESYQSDVTENTVEYGFKISDHIITKSPEITVEGVISDYTINMDEAELYWDGDKFVNTFALMGSENIGNHYSAKQAIIDIVQKRKLFTIIATETYVDIGDVTTAEENLDAIHVSKFTNCVMPTLSFPNKSGVNGATFVNFTAKQIRVAKTLVEDIDTNSIKPVVAKKAIVTAGSTKDANGKPVGDRKEAGKESDTVGSGDNSRGCELIKEELLMASDLADPTKSNSTNRAEGLKSQQMLQSKFNYYNCGTTKTGKNQKYAV